MSDPSSPTQFGHPSTWTQPTPQPPRRRALPVLIVAVAAVVLLGGGATLGALLLGDRHPAVTEAADTVSPSPTWSSVFGANPTLTSGPNDANGLRGCRELANASGSQDQYDAATMEEIGKIFVISADSSLRLHGQLLIDRAKLAKAANGKGDELSLIADMVTTATDLGTYCLQHGYVKP